MRKLGKCFLILMFLWGVRARAQTATANLTAQDTGACTTANACLTITLNENQASSVVQLNGTFSATLQFEGSSQSGGTFVAVNAVPVGGTTAVTSATSTGAWRIAVAGLRQVRVRCSSFVSGTVAVVMTSSQGSSANNTSISGAGVTTFNSRSGAVAPASGDYTAAQVTGVMPAFASYTVFPATSSACTTPSITGTTYCARNNATGAFDYNGTDAAVVVNSILTANATVGGTLYFKNGVYNVNSLTAEAKTGCSTFDGSGKPIDYAFGFPAQSSFANSVEWVIEGESTTVWQGEEGSTTVNNSGVVFNITPTAVSSVTAGNILVGWWQSPLLNCTLNTAGVNLNNELVFNKITTRFPVNTRGNEIAYAPYFASTVQYGPTGTVAADFNVSYNTLATGSAPTVGTYNSIGLASTMSTAGNVQAFINTYSSGYNLAYDFQSEHITGTNVTAIYSNIACEFGRSAGGVFHFNQITNFMDQENGAGCIFGPQIQQGTIFDLAFDFELGNDGNWYTAARGGVAKLTESNCGYGTGIIRYQAVLQNVGVVAELPASNLFTSCGQNFQALEATSPPSLALTPITDTFTRPNTTPAAASNGLGPMWQNGTQTGNHNLKIVSNSAQVTDTGNQLGYSAYLATTFNPDQFSRATCSILVAAANFCEVMVRASTVASVQTYYTYYVGGTAAAGRGIIKNVAAVSTTLASQTSAAGAAGDVIELRVIGSTLWAYRNGALDTSFTNPVVDSSITSGNPGINLVDAATSGVAITNWSGGNFPTLHGTDSIYNNPGYHTTYNTVTNCSSGASPAVCGSAAAGSIAVPTGTNATLQVNTTAVTANSQIFVQSDDTLGTKLGVTCNSTLASLIVEPVVSTRVAGASFTVTISGTTTTNPVCLSYFIVN